MKYVLEIKLICRFIDIATAHGELQVIVESEDVAALPRRVVQGIEVDEARYALAHEDIGSAVGDGTVGCRRPRFIHDAYCEGRLPSSIAADERWYPPEHTDVAKSVSSDTANSAQDRYDSKG